MNHTHTHTLMMQKQKRRATFPRATGAFLSFFLRWAEFSLIRLPAPHTKKKFQGFFFWGGGGPSTKDHTGHHTHTRCVCVCVPSGFSSWLRGHSKQQPSSCWAEPSVAVPQQQNRSVNSKKKRRRIFNFLGLFEGNFQLEHHFLTKFRKNERKFKYFMIQLCRKVGIWRNEWTN